jgi:hypothetical protein
MLVMENATMPTAENPTELVIPLRPEGAAQRRIDRLILVYDGDSGLGAMLLGVVKKSVGKEECALCEITYGPLGKRGTWRACEARLGVIVDELHRDQLPESWGLLRTELPCILGRVRDERPFIVVTRDDIVACRGSADALEQRLRTALSLQRREQ